MRVLILTCNTGGGHNACARALQENFLKNGCHCDTADTISFVSKNLSRFMSWGHTTMYRHAPRLFHFGYDFAEKHPAILNEKAPVYKLLTGGTKKLHAFLQAGGYDTVICTHVFSGLLLHRTLLKYPAALHSAFISTDYTCSPGAAQGCPDYCFIPSERQREEFIRQGVPDSRIIATGIPVREAFYTRTDRRQAREKLGIGPEDVHLLMMCGSMGCGPMEKTARLLRGKMTDGMVLSIVCGTNEKLRKKLEERFGGDPRIRVHGFVEDISTMMDSADLYLTKPGGLSTSEALAKGLPMVFVDTVSGCEAYNLEYFTALGGAVAGDTPEELARLCLELMKDGPRREAMARRLDAALPGNAVRQIYETMKEAAA